MPDVIVAALSGMAGRRGSTGAAHFQRLACSFSSTHKTTTAPVAGTATSAVELGQVVDMTARIKRREVVHGLINEHRRATERAQKHQLRAILANSGTARHARSAGTRARASGGLRPGAGADSHAAALKHSPNAYFF
jgi:hypothetical protein